MARAHIYGNFSQPMRNKIEERHHHKCERLGKYSNFERDLKIMYMKSVFNCFNEFLIEAKSVNSYINSRSSFGPGELTLAIKEYNKKFKKS